MKKYLAIFVAVAGVAIGAPAAYAGNINCFHDSWEDPIDCIEASIEASVPQPQGTVVLRDKDCNYLVVRPEPTVWGEGGINLTGYSFVHKVDGERPKLFARLFGFIGFGNAFVEGKERNLRTEGTNETVRLDTIATGLTAYEGAQLFVERCKSAK